MPGPGAILTTVLLFSVSQMLPCGPGPKPVYRYFAKQAAAGRCARVYRTLDTSSQARLDAYLETMVSMALAVEAQTENAGLALESYQPGPADMDDFQRWLDQVPWTPLDPSTVPSDGGVEDTEADGAVTEDGLAPETLAVAAMRADAPEELQLQNRRRKALKKLWGLRGKALFKRLCRPNMVPLRYLYREAGLEHFHPHAVAEPFIEEDKALLPIKGRAKVSAEGQAPPPDTPGVQMVKEGGKWRVVLEPMSLRWYTTADGRVVPRFNSPILSLGVEPDHKRTPTRVYNLVVDHVLHGRCQEFYELLDSGSQRHMERVAPMMVGFASAVGAANKRGQAPPPRDGRSLVLTMCKRASLGDQKASGFHLGEVVDEQVSNDQAMLTVRGRKSDVTREVLMRREKGDWRLSIEAFSGLVVDYDLDDGVDDDEEEDTKAKK